MLKRFLLSILPALLTVSCAIKPEPVVRYRAAGSDAFWEKGLQFTRAGTARFGFSYAFVELSPAIYHGGKTVRPLYYQISAANSSDAEGLIDPRDFRIAIPGKDMLLAALDPEEAIHQARKDLAAEKASHSDPLGVEVAFGLGTVLSAVGESMVDKTPDQAERLRKDEEERRRLIAESEERHLRTRSEIEARLDFWSRQVLRKTTLLPGTRIEGRLAFAYDPHSPPPDTLILQYRESDGRHADLGRLVLVPDSIGTPPPKKTHPPPGLRWDETNRVVR